MQSLLAGRWPSRDHTGAMFPDGSWRAKMAGSPMPYRAAILSKLGDWAWLKACLNLRGWRGQGPDLKCCWLCHAGLKEACNAYQFDLAADWRHRRQTMADFSEELLHERFPSGIWSIHGMTITSVRSDWMHVVCLGILQYLQGNIVLNYVVSWRYIQALGRRMQQARNHDEGNGARARHGATFSQSHIGHAPP